MPRYLSTLCDLGIIERVCPFGENPQTSRRGVYRIREASFAFWYRFVMPRMAMIEDGMGELVAERLTDETLNTYLAHWFALFSRHPVHDATAQKYVNRDELMFVTLDQMYRH